MSGNGEVFSAAPAPACWRGSPRDLPWTPLKATDTAPTVGRVTGTRVQLSLVRQLLELVWRQHFRIPEAAYWAALLVGAAGFSADTPEEALAWGLLVLASVVGISRWHWHRRKSRVLVVPRFSTVRGDEGMAIRVQELVLTDLEDTLPPHFLDFVHSIPAVVGPRSRDFAARLRRRLRAMYLLHGRIDRRGDGGWAVFARVLQPTDRGVLHFDLHTRDITPARARWEPLVELLTPTKEVVAEEYPLEFTTELKAIVRGTAGQVALAYEDYPRAEELLREALAHAPESTSHQIDQLRLALARSLAGLDRHDEGLELLRQRAKGRDPSPALLRGLHHLLWRKRISRDPVPEAEAREGIRALRAAAAKEADPEHDLTLYNLAMALSEGNEQEQQDAETILRGLMRESRVYRRTWYVPFKLGALHYERGTRASTEGEADRARAEFREAARLYSRGLRARPRVRFFFRDGPRLWLMQRFPPSPQMYANAGDAHGGAGHRLRWGWHEFRFQRTRSKMLRRAEKAVRRGNWDAAYAHFDWAVVGRWDELELTARIMRAVALKQQGEHDAAEEDWADTVQEEPGALLLRAGIAEQLGANMVPGHETTDMDEAVRLAERRRAIAGG